MSDPAEDLERAMDENRADPPEEEEKPRRKPRTSAAVQKKVRPKFDSYESMARRRKVQSLRLRGLSYQEIANKLQVSEVTVASDLEKLRKGARDAVDQFHQAQQTGDALAVYDELAAKAWEEFENATDENGDPVTTARLKCLDLVRTIQNDKMRALHECGLLEKVADKVEHRVAYQLPWDANVKQRVAQAMLESALSPMLPAPQPEVIDVLEVAPPEAEVVQQLQEKTGEGEK